VETETISQKCDWIAFTVPFYKDLTWTEIITTNWKTIPPIAHFTDAQENGQGIRVYWHKTRPQMGKHVIVSGSSLAYIGEGITEFLAHIVGSGYKVTRIDFAVDIIHSDLNPRNASYHLEKGQAKTHAQKAPKWADALGVGYTQYIGKKTSETYCRIYDKASEMGVNYRWVRVEVVYQGGRALPAAKAYLQCEDCRSLVKAFIDFPKWRKWIFVMEAKTVKVRTVSKQSNTRDWLLKQVAKSLAKEMTLDDDQEFYLTFLQRVREEYLRLTSSEDDINF
jgi:hypothetical protein